MHVTVRELHANLDEAYVLDVRDPDEFKGGHVPGAVPMPMPTVPVRYSELPRDTPIWVICQSGGRSHTAATWLAHQGYDVRNVQGGTSEWISAGLPVQTGSD